MSKIGRSGKSGRSGRSTICSLQFGPECQGLEEVEEVRFVASNLGLSVNGWKKWKKWKKYDLLPAI